MNIGEIWIDNRAKERLKRNESHTGGDAAQNIDAVQILRTLDGRPEPNVVEHWEIRFGENAKHSVRALCQNLERMPVRKFHHAPDLPDESFVGLLLE
jgi:hypothetical protein